MTAVVDEWGSVEHLSTTHFAEENRVITCVVTGPGTADNVCNDSVEETYTVWAFD